MRKPSLMMRLPLSRLICIPLLLLLLSPTGTSLFHPSSPLLNSGCTLIRSQSGSKEALFQETPSVSHVLGLESERSSKLRFFLTCLSASFSASAKLAPRLRLFCPRGFVPESFLSVFLSLRHRLPSAPEDDLSLS